MQSFIQNWLENIAFGPIFYLGPESIMPLASVIAAVIGFLLIFWRSIVKFGKKIFRIGSDQSEAVTPYIEPDDDTLGSDTSEGILLSEEIIPDDSHKNIHKNEDQVST